MRQLNDSIVAPAMPSTRTVPPLRLRPGSEQTVGFRYPAGPCEENPFFDSRTMKICGFPTPQLIARYQNSGESKKRTELGVGGGGLAAEPFERL